MNRSLADIESDHIVVLSLDSGPFQFRTNRRKSSRVSIYSLLRNKMPHMAIAI